VLDVSAVTPDYLLRSPQTTVARAADVTGTVHYSGARVQTKNVAQTFESHVFLASAFSGNRPAFNNNLKVANKFLH